MSHFDVYGELASDNWDDTSKNGRYSSQKDAESMIPKDVLNKLRIVPHDHVLDIGCGTGINITAMADIVENIVGCDHPKVIEIAMKNNPKSNVFFQGGSFLDLKFDKKFQKILIYGVLSTLQNKEIVYRFIEKAMSLLSNDGRMLIGDIPNIDKKNRFLKSDRGRKFQKEWMENNTNSSAKESTVLFKNAGDTVSFDDDFIVEILQKIRTLGFHAYLLDQPQNLPFGNSREDILIVGSEYEE